jgi:hypothetical protein
MAWNASNGTPAFLLMYSMYTLMPLPPSYLN